MGIDTILLKTAGRCNINCTYCYVYNMGDTGWQSQPKVMSTAVVESVIDNLGDLSRTQSKGFSVVLHGGEPLLLGLKKLGRLLCGLRCVLPQCCTLSIQTNGILIDDALLDLCSETRTTIAVSMDGPPGVHNRHRLDFSGRGTFEKTISGIRRLQNHSDSEFLFSGTLSVIDPGSNPAQVYRFFKDLGTPSMDFLLRDGNRSRLPVAKKSLQSREYGEWLVQLFDLYIEDPSPVPIRILMTS